MLQIQGKCVSHTHLRALSDRLVIEVQEARSRCFSLGQNLLRLLHVLQRRKDNEPFQREAA